MKKGADGGEWRRDSGTARSIKEKGEEMLKICGACILVLGSFGFGWCICREMDRRSELLGLLERAFVMLESEVGYSRATLPEGLCRVGRRLGGETAAPAKTEHSLGECFCRIGGQACGVSGHTLTQIWEREIPAFLSETCLKGREKALLLSFPEFTGFADGKMQLRALEQFGGLVEEARKKAAGEACERRRVVLSVSTACGILTAILML